MEKNNRDGRKVYTSPEIKRRGTVSELTRVGVTNAGQDWIPGNGKVMNGSVYPPANGRGNGNGNGNPNR